MRDLGRHKKEKKTRVTKVQRKGGLDRDIDRGISKKEITKFIDRR